MSETNAAEETRNASKAVAKQPKSTKKSGDKTAVDDKPNDRPMTGILQKDDGRRTEHGLHPLDPAYSGTVLDQNKGVDEARTARVDAGLEEDEKTAA